MTTADLVMMFVGTFGLAMIVAAFHLAAQRLRRVTIIRIPSKRRPDTYGYILPRDYHEAHR